MPHGRKRSYMKKSEETLEDFAISYPLDKLAPLERYCFSILRPRDLLPVLLIYI